MLSPPLSAGILAVNQIHVIYDPRACISIPQRPDYQGHPRGRSLPSLGLSPAIHCIRIKGECPSSHGRSPSFPFSYVIRQRQQRATSVASLCGLPRDFERISDHGRAASVRFSDVWCLIRRGGILCQ